MHGWTFADIWETVADCLPDAAASIHGGQTTTWREFDQRGDGLAQFLLDSGCSQQDKVAHYLYNRPEYLETFFACSKASLVHVNTNYRYGDSELIYIWDNADVSVVVFQGAFSETIERIRMQLPKVSLWLWVEDTSEDQHPQSLCPDWATPYEEAVATPNSGRVRGPSGRDGHDLVLLYTGGTTGMPKGVMWRQGDLFGANDRLNKTPLPTEPDLDDHGYSLSVRARTTKPGPVSIPACPLMHGTGLFNSLNTLCLGGAIATLSGTRFTIEEFFDTIKAAQAKSVFIVGDAFAKPMIDALDDSAERGDNRWDLSSLRVVLSSGVMWSTASKQQLLSHYPNLILVDTYGSSEAIGMGSSVSSGDKKVKTAAFSLGPNSVVITDDGNIVEPGSGEIGKVGIRGLNPIGYYKDEEKSSAAFPVVNGVRYSIPGDFATVEADGTITLLGRGSVCINTGGEKVFPEEVEEALKLHPAIEDAIALGVANDRFGQEVQAVVVSNQSTELDIAEVIDHVKGNLAGYKAPRQVHVVASLERGANGKVDYKRWTSYAETATTHNNGSGR